MRMNSRCAVLEGTRNFVAGHMAGFRPTGSVMQPFVRRGSSFLTATGPSRPLPSQTLFRSFSSRSIKWLHEPLKTKGRAAITATATTTCRSLFSLTSKRACSSDAPFQELQGKVNPMPEDVQQLFQRFFAWQKQTKSFQIAGIHVPKFWLLWAAFSIHQGISMFTTLRNDSPAHLGRPRWVSTQMREGFVLQNAILPVGLDKNLFYFLFLPFLSIAFAASVGILWARMRTNRDWQKFITTHHGGELGQLFERAPKQAIEQAKQLVISASTVKTAIAASMISSLTLGLEYSSTKASSSNYINFMTARQWHYPPLREATKEELDALDSVLPSPGTLLLSRGAVLLLGAVAMLAALSYSPYVFLPMSASIFPLLTALLESPAKIRFWGMMQPPSPSSSQRKHMEEAHEERDEGEKERWGNEEITESQEAPVEPEGDWRDRR
ncbi:hypothetical protein QOT17_006045 [Balamuthia mandrillaris]